MSSGRPTRAGGAGRPRLSVWLSLRGAWSSLMDNLGSFALANVLWALTAACVALARAAYPPAVVLVLVMVPVTCGLMRMAGHAARDSPARLGQFLEGVRHRPWLHLVLGAGQSLLLLTAAGNLAAGLGGGRVLSVALAVVSGYVALATWMVATAAWPLLLDPARHTVPWTTALRLAATVAVMRPVGIVVIVVIEAVLVAVTVQTVLPGLLLPSYGVLLAAHHVLAAADQLEGPSRATPGDRA